MPGSNDTHAEPSTGGPTNSPLRATVVVSLAKTIDWGSLPNEPKHGLLCADGKMINRVA